MGKVPDAVLAKEAGVSLPTVGAYRRKHGLPAYVGRSLERGERSSKANRSAPSKATSGKKRRGRKSRLDRFADRIGVDSDGAIAAAAGVSRTTVTAWRARHGVPAAGSNRVEEKPASGTGSPLEAFLDQLGKTSDGDIAERAGVPRAVVAAYRRQHDILAWQGFRTAPRARSASKTVAPARTPPLAAEAPVVSQEQRTRAVRTPAPASAVVSPGVNVARPLLAYTVLVLSPSGQQEFIAVGGDIADACRHALHGLETRTDGPWSIERVEVLGEALG